MLSTQGIWSCFDKENVTKEVLDMWRSNKGLLECCQYLSARGMACLARGHGHSMFCTCQQRTHKARCCGRGSCRLTASMDHEMLRVSIDLPCTAHAQVAVSVAEPELIGGELAPLLLRYQCVHTDRRDARLALHLDRQPGTLARSLRVAFAHAAPINANRGVDAAESVVRPSSFRQIGALKGCHKRRWRR